MSRVFTIFCALLATFITVSGIVSYKKPEDLLLQFIFLPVTVYLIVASFRHSPLYLKDKKIVLTVTTALFVSLIGWGLIRILQL